MSTSDVKDLDLEAIWKAPKPLIDFVLPGLAIGTVGMVVATGGTGKTFAMLATAMGLAVGRDVGNIWGESPKPGHAVFLSLEDPEIAMRSRLHALRSLIEEHEVASACERLHVLAYAGHGLSLATSVEGEPEVTEWFGKVKAYLKKVGARLCVVDTLNRALGGISENDAGAMGSIIGQIESLAREVGCAVVLCHHVSKQALMDRSGEAHAARGSSVITDNARWQCNLSGLAEKDLRFRVMDEVERRRIVQLTFSKMNYGPMIASRWLRRDDDGVLSHHEDVPRSKTSSSRQPDAAAETGPQASGAAHGETVPGNRKRASAPAYSERKDYQSA